MASCSSDVIGMTARKLSSRSFERTMSRVSLSLAERRVESFGSESVADAWSRSHTAIASVLSDWTKHAIVSSPSH